MTAADFRRIALGFEGAEEGSHMGAADFRVGGRIFATLAHEAMGYANLMLSPELQADLLAEAPEVFLPVAGGWGRNGATHARLAGADGDLLRGALQMAWNRRVQMNAKGKRKAVAAEPRALAAKPRAVAAKSKAVVEKPTSVKARDSAKR